MPRLLYDSLAALSPTLKENFDAVAKAASEIWDEQHHRTFTTHGLPHYTQVERNLDALTAPLQRSNAPLIAEEIYVLLCACYLHDIGMQLERPDARERHAQYSYEMILNSEVWVDEKKRTATLPILGTNARQSIARVARAHWSNFALALPSEDFIHNTVKGRLRLLGCLLATADLLDLSPVRARYFNSQHRLGKLDPTAELHQKMHSYVRGFEIKAADTTTPDLHFSLAWQSDDQVIREVCGWVMRSFEREWRLISPILRTESGGAIRWQQDSWAVVKFHPKIAPLEPFSKEALQVMRHECAKMDRINRDAFVSEYLDCLGNRKVCVLGIPGRSEVDGQQIARWCYSHAAVQHGCKAAGVEVRMAAPIDVSSLVGAVLEQFGTHMPKASDADALKYLEADLSGRTSESLVLVLTIEDEDDGLLNHIIKIFVDSWAHHGGARIVLLVAPEKHLKRYAAVSSSSTNWGVLAQVDIAKYLVDHRGHTVDTAAKLVEQATIAHIDRSPGWVFPYLDKRCRAWEEVRV